MASKDVPAVTKKFRELLEATPDMNAAVAAIRSLTEVMEGSEATTMMQVQQELQAASEQLTENTGILSVGSGCELYRRFVTRAFLDISDFNECKRLLVERGKKFTHATVASRTLISKHVESFVQDGSTLLVHGHSRVVACALGHAHRNHKRFTVLVTESRPDNAGVAMLHRLEGVGVQGTLIMDAEVGHVMEKVDMVLVGAAAVVENGGIINKIGTFQTAMVAKACNTPFFVAVESYKFTRFYPLNQSDLPSQCQREAGPFEPIPNLPKSTTVRRSACDYTPPQYIQLLFTDLGVLTPSAVSDELIQLYN